MPYRFWGLLDSCLAANEKIIILMVVLFANAALADEYVNGYIRSNGTQVQSYGRSSPNITRYDNYSTQGNTNPYTGQKGTVSPNVTSPSRL